jgi:hypothetical protein
LGGELRRSLAVRLIDCEFCRPWGMKQENHMARWLAATALSLMLASSLPALAQKHFAQAYPARPLAQKAPAPRPQGHAGDWLRRYKDLPPAEQEKALQNDPAFRRLPPQRQELLRQRLQHFSSLPPQEQLRMLNRMETWEHLTPEQKQQARRLYSQFKELPPGRQRMVTAAVRDLRAMPPEQREQVINSDRFRSTFSDQEREMMSEATRLPLAPAEAGEAEPHE